MANGNLLRETRESLGLTLEAAEEATKIRRKYLDALEREDYGELPGRVYAKAFLRTYAKYLGLDSDVVIGEFEARHPLQETDMESKGPVVSTPRKRPAIFRLLLVVGVIAGLFAFNAFYGGGSRGGPEQAPPAPISNEDSGGPPEAEEFADENPVTVDPVSNDSTPDKVEVVLVVTERPSWIRVTVDGVDEFQGMVSPGETLDFTGRESVSFRVGDAGAVELHLNGENLGPVGNYGDVVDREFVVGG